MEKELNDKESTIKHLHNEIDKFRQVVRPITKKIIDTKQFLIGNDKTDEEDNKIEPRIKRQAISAEPLGQQQTADLQINKIPKSAT